MLFRFSAQPTKHPTLECTPAGTWFTGLHVTLYAEPSLAPWLKAQPLHILWKYPLPEEGPCFLDPSKVRQLRLCQWSESDRCVGAVSASDVDVAPDAVPEDEAQPEDFNLVFQSKYIPTLSSGH